MSKSTKRILAVVAVILVIAFLVFIMNPDIMESFNSGTVGP